MDGWTDDLRGPFQPMILCFYDFCKSNTQKLQEKKQRQVFSFMIFLVSHRGNERIRFSCAAMTISLITPFHVPTSFTLRLLQQVKQPSGAFSSRARPS